MRNVFKCLFLTGCLCTLCSPADVLEFRLDQNRLWLTAKDEPLPQLLERFAAAGIDVQIDPAAQKNVTGSCSAADVEKILDELLTPYDYLLDWQREAGPLGTLTRLTGIRVFRSPICFSAICELNMLDNGCADICPRCQVVNLCQIIDPEECAPIE